MLLHQIDEVSKFEIGVLVEQIRALNLAIGRLSDKLVEVGSQLEGHKNVVSIKGI